MSIRRRHAEVVAIAALLAAAAIAAHHVYAIRGHGWTDLEFVASVAFLWLSFTSVLPYLHREVIPPPWNSAARRRLDRLRVTVIVPAHNEDPAMLLAMLDSLAAQTRSPARIHVVENGDPARGYRPALRELFEDWATGNCPAGVKAVYTFNPIAGKRQAQAVAVAADPRADIYLTLDSDVKLAPGAIEAGLAPFARREVTSVGGLLVGLNRSANLLTRLVEPQFVCASLNGRVAQSMLGEVGVNSGALAFYRGRVAREYMEHYLTHTVAGRRMMSGDDAMLTRYALLEGKAVFQVECWGYTLHPERLGHLSKQRVRWWRSFWWGDIWLLRTFSPRRPLWWLTAWEFVAFGWVSVVLPYVFLVQPVLTGHFPWQLVAWPIGITYLSTARYLTIARPGESFAAHLGTWALAPISTVLNLYLGFVLCYVGLFTCTRNGWSSRGTVEVGLGGTATPPVIRHGRTPKPRAAAVRISDVPTMMFPVVPLPRHRGPQPPRHSARCRPPGPC